MVSLNADVESQWAQVENVYQSRMDKTKNLMEIVKGAANFEKETLTEIVQARSNAGSVKLQASEINDESLAKFQKAQDQFSGALSKLMVVVEKYPDLKAVEAFRDFQAQYEGMENRITVERGKFNDVSKSFNTYIATFPNNTVAGMFGFHKKPYFTAAAGAEKAPDVKF